MTSETTAAAPAVERRPTRRRFDAPRIGWLAVVAAALWPLFEAIRLITGGQNVGLWGDQAVMELASRRAWHLDQLVGPYSRYGFHHPGPALFYISAPFVRLLEPAGPGMYLAAVVINGAAMVAVVAYLWRRFGVPCALVAAGLVNLFAWSVEPGVLRYPWNPYLVVLPIFLLVVLVAGSIAGGGPGSWLWAAVVGSYCVQTHISTAVFVVLLIAVAGGFALVRGVRSGARRLRAADWWRSPARIVGLVALVLIWVPPVVELFRDNPNNLTAMWNFFTGPRASVPFHVARQTVARAITIFPYGNQSAHNNQALYRPGWQLLAFDLGFVAFVVAAAVIGWLRRNRFALALAGAAVAGPIVGTLALMRAAGDIYPYITLWLAFVPVAAVLALVVAVLAPARPGIAPARPGIPPAPAPARSRATPVTAAAAVVAVVGAGLLLQAGVRTRPADQAPVQPIVSGQVMASTVMRMLGPSDHWVGFTLETADSWPDLAATVLDLDRRGIQSTVAPKSALLMFGDERAAGRPVAAQFELYQTTDPQGAAKARGRVVAHTGIDVLTYVGP